MEFTSAAARGLNGARTEGALNSYVSERRARLYGSFRAAEKGCDLTPTPLGAAPNPLGAEAKASWEGSNRGVRRGEGRAKRSILTQN